MSVEPSCPEDSNEGSQDRVLLRNKKNCILIIPNTPLLWSSDYTMLIINTVDSRYLEVEGTL